MKYVTRRQASQLLVCSYLSALILIRDFCFFFIAKGVSADLLVLALEHRKNLSSILTGVSYDEANNGELAAMVSFAIAFPNGFLALVDTYDVKR